MARIDPLTTRGTATVAVRADDFALCHLLEDALPAPVRELIPDVEALVAQMVQIEDDRIGLTAVAARVRGEVLEEEQRPLMAPAPLLRRRPLLVELAVSRIVGLSVGGAASAAM